MSKAKITCVFFYITPFSFLPVIRTAKLKAVRKVPVKGFPFLLSWRRSWKTGACVTPFVPIRSGGVTAKGNSKSAPLLLPVPRPSHGRKSTRQERNCSWLPARVEASSWRDLGAIFRSAPLPQRSGFGRVVSPPPPIFFAGERFICFFSFSFFSYFFSNFTSPFISCVYVCAPFLSLFPALQHSFAWHPDHAGLGPIHSMLCFSKNADRGRKKGFRLFISRANLPQDWPPGGGREGEEGIVLSFLACAWNTKCWSRNNALKSQAVQETVACRWSLIYSPSCEQLSWERFSKLAGFLLG